MAMDWFISEHLACLACRTHLNVPHRLICAVTVRGVMLQTFFVVAVHLLPLSSSCDNHREKKTTTPTTTSLLCVLSRGKHERAPCRASIRILLYYYYYFFFLFGLFFFVVRALCCTKRAPHRALSRVQPRTDLMKSIPWKNGFNSFYYCYYWLRVSQQQKKCVSRIPLFLLHLNLADQHGFEELNRKRRRACRFALRTNKYIRKNASDSVKTFHIKNKAPASLQNEATSDTMMRGNMTNHSVIIMITCLTLFFFFLISYLFKNATRRASLIPPAPPWPSNNLLRCKVKIGSTKFLKNVRKTINKTSGPIHPSWTGSFSM